MNPPTHDTTSTCAAAGCDQPVTRGRRGRPPIYCSPACRPGRTPHSPAGLVVEVDHDPMPDHSRPTGRIWKVQLRRSGHTVIIATELGRPSADHLASQIDRLLNPRPPADRAAID